MLFAWSFYILGFSLNFPDFLKIVRLVLGAIYINGLKWTSLIICLVFVLLCGFPCVLWFLLLYTTSQSLRSQEWQEVMIITSNPTEICFEDFNIDTCTQPFSISLYIFFTQVSHVDLFPCPTIPTPTLHNQGPLGMLSVKTPCVPSPQVMVYGGLV